MISFCLSLIPPGHGIWNRERLLGPHVRGTNKAEFILERERERESVWDMDRGRRSVDVIPVFQYFWGVNEVELEGKPAAVLLLKNPMHERTLHPPAGQFL
jgi:hypothetical protein